MSRIFIKFTLALAMVLLFTQNALATNVGIFNFPEIMQQSAVAKTADAELKSRFGEESKALDAEFATLQKNIADFQKQAAALSETARREKAQELETQSRVFEGKRQQLTSQLTPLQQEMEKELKDVLKVACTNYAKANNFDIIIDGALTAFVSTDADITNEIIAEMDKVWKSRGSKFK